MSMVECKSCGLWVDPDDAEGAYDKGAPFGWKCDECLADDCEKADEKGYRVRDEEAFNDMMQQISTEREPCVSKQS